MCYRRSSSVLDSSVCQRILPSYSQSAQWQLVLMLFLKALSLRRAPFLRTAFESRGGIGRFNLALATRRFTVEEFCAALELLVPETER